VFSKEHHCSTNLVAAVSVPSKIWFRPAPNMEFLEPTFHHFQQHQQHQGLSSYSDPHHSLHNYAMAAQQPSMIGMPASTSKSNETKPRLGKDEVEILEREFKKNPKPSTQTKRQFAEEMGVDLARINVRRILGYLDATQ
jgi:hypothetical protein